MSDVNWCCVEFNVTSCTARVSTVRILYELYTVKWQSASPPVTADFKENKDFNI